MQIADHLDILRAEGTALAEAADRAGLDADVPSCPGWQVRELVGHIGSVHRWAGAIVLAPPGSGRIPMPEAPAEGLLDWYRESHGQLLSVLADVSDDVQCWTFLPAPTPKAFWARRQAHETAMHRADATLAAGEPAQFHGEFAADGIDELLFGFLGRSRSNLIADPPRSLLIRPTDVDAWWHISVGPDGHAIRTTGDQHADCVVSASASDLYLLLWNRLPPAAAPEVSGDASVLDIWRERATI